MDQANSDSRERHFSQQDLNTLHPEEKYTVPRCELCTCHLIINELSQAIGIRHLITSIVITQ